MIKILHKIKQRRVNALVPKRIIVYAFIWIGVFLVHCFYLSRADGVLLTADSGGYYELSRLRLTSAELWGGGRPPVVPLLYKLLSTYDYDHRWDPNWSNIYVDDEILMWSQTLFSIVAFTFLGFVCTKAVRTATGGMISFATPLFFSLTPLVSRWNFMAMSESFSCSFFVVFVASWILFLVTKHPLCSAGIVGAALLWAGSRDTNAYVLILIVVVTMIVVIVGTLQTRKKRSAFPSHSFPVRPPLVTLTVFCILFSGIFALSNFSVGQGARWEFPFYNIMGKRILPVSRHVEYFAKHGMPVSRDLLERRERFASDDDYAFYGEPLRKFRAWAVKDGKTTYIQFLLSHFSYSIVEPTLWFQEKFLNDIINDVAGPGQSQSSKISASILCLLLAGYVILICLSLILWHRGELSRFPYLIVPLGMISLSVPHAGLVYHADAMGIQRHCLTALVQGLLGFVLFCIFMYDIHSDTNHQACSSSMALSSKKREWS